MTVCCGRLESTARTVTVAVPSAVAVPEMIPAGLRVRPAGSEPVWIDQVYGPIPPEADSVAE